MAYYHDLITEKSWRLLQDLKRHYDFILIGGWAVYLYTHALKSKDIDFVCEYKVLEQLRTDHPLTKNERLKKYEIKFEETDVDIYVPFFSDLAIPLERLREASEVHEGFRVPKKEILLILKQRAYLDRGYSLKGEKDRIDMIALIKSGLDWKHYHKFLKQFELTHYASELIVLLKGVSEVPELGLNAHAMARLKKDVLSHLR